MGNGYSSCPPASYTPYSPFGNSNTIRDKYTTYDALQAALRSAGLESSNLIVAVDFTASNNWTGARTFGGRSLHCIDPAILNPYQSAMRIIATALAPFDDDQLIPAYGFGDATTSDQRVFSFYDHGPCNGLGDLLERYADIVPQIQLSGPTSFAPAIKQAIEIVKQTGQYHILIIIADGQVSAPMATTNAIVEASNYPLSIVVVGVGDGPWEQMIQYDNGLPERRFDNFQFVDFHDVMVKNDGSEIAFATAAMQEIPDQYKAIRSLNLFNNCVPQRAPVGLAPPVFQ